MITATPPALSPSIPRGIDRGSPPNTHPSEDRPIRFERVSRIRALIFFNRYTIEDKLDAVIDRLAENLT